MVSFQNITSFQWYLCCNCHLAKQMSVIHTTKHLKGSTVKNVIECKCHRNFIECKTVNALSVLVRFQHSVIEAICTNPDLSMRVNLSGRGGDEVMPWLGSAETTQSWLFIICPYCMECVLNWAKITCATNVVFLYLERIAMLSV